MSSSAETMDDNASPSLEQIAARFFGPTAPRIQIEFGAVSDPGRRRKNNEDHFAVVKRQRSREVLLTNLPDDALPHVVDETYVMVVADGVGGAAFGELASMLALQTAWELTSHAFKWPFQINERESQELFKQIELYGQLMNKVINQKAREDPEMEGMGTTLTGAIIIAGEAFIGHVGDSRAYLFRNGELRQLTHDHTLAQKLVDDGTLPSLDVAKSFMKHILVNCLGGKSEDVSVDVHRVALANDDRLLFCTDGLTDMVDDHAISRILSQNFDSQKTCDELVVMALKAGGRDNVTVIVARIDMPTKTATAPKE